jgi:hypothetical protein
MLKTPEGVLRNALISDAGVTRFIGHRVLYDLAASEDSLPFVNYRRADISRETIYAATRLQTRQIADAVRRVLDGYSGTFDNTEVRQTSLESESDEVITLEGSEIPNVYAVTQTYDIWWQET